MNAQIRELAEQAQQYAEHTTPQGLEWFDCFKHKFAELIVRECAEVISNGRYSNMACEGNTHRISYNNGRYGASLDIKKHFGVEL